MTNSRLYSYLNYLFIAVAILWKPLQGTILTFDGKGRILLFLTIMLFFINCNKGAFKKILFSKPIVLWLIWCLYVTANTYIKGYDSSNVPFLYFISNQVFCPFIIMAVSANEYLKNPQLFLKTILVIYLVYAFIGAFIMDIGYIAHEEGTVDANTLGNSLSLNVIMIIFVAGVMYCHKYLSLKYTTALIIFAIGIVLVSATRKAFGAGIIMIMALILSHIKWNLGNFIKLLFPMAVLLIGLNYVISSTQMGKRISHLEEQTDQINTMYDIGDNAFLRAMGDRAPQYILGTELFMENPVTGIGLTNFQRKSGYPYRLHTEYMVQICECGIIGCILFIVFYADIIRRLIRKIKNSPGDKKKVIMMLGGIAALLFIYLTTWSYSIYTYFLPLGCIIGYTLSNNIKKFH